MQIIAHRGASGEFPENSLLAFEHAIEQQADAIELDVQFHQASQEFIVLHDSYLDKVSNAKGEINQFSLSRLLQVSLGQEQCIITLTQALIHIGDRCLINIEVKSATTEPQTLLQEIEVLKQTIDEAINFNHLTPEQIIVSSFNHMFISQYKQQSANIATGALIAHIPIDFASFTEQLNCDYLNVELPALNPELVKDAQRRGLKVWVFTVDRIADIHRCQELFVDGIFTNFPRKSRLALR